MKIAQGILPTYWPGCQPECVAGIDASHPDETTSHSTKPASGQVAGYLPHEGEGRFSLKGKDGIFEQNIAAMIEEARQNRPDLLAPGRR